MSRRTVIKSSIAVLGLVFLAEETAGPDQAAPDKGERQWAVDQAQYWTGLQQEAIEGKGRMRPTL